MVSTSNGKGMEEVEEGLGSGTTSIGPKGKNRSPLHVSTSQKGLLAHEKPQNKVILDNLTAPPSRVGFQKLSSAFPSFASSSAKFQCFAEERDKISRSVPSCTSQGLRERFSVPFVRKINWDSLKKVFIQWIRNPMNMALFVWITVVAVSGAILFLVMTGMLNHVIPKKSQRNTWFEVNNQILNALFTLMCLYQHPKRFYHLVLLCRWRPEDISRLRKIYCKDGTYKPHEWAHMMVVIVLLHLNCFAQYALCGLNLGYKRSERPAIGVAICISVAIASPAIAGLYTILSPLGKEYESEMDHEAQIQTPLNDNSMRSPLRANRLEKKFSFASREDGKVVVEKPEWSGGLFDFWDDISLAYLSFFCTFCVFGWNMERLGFGNMYVHIATFILFCFAPFWIFNLAALNIDNETVRGALGVTGVVLCIFGLLYGGFWRIQMRKRFNLPASDFCCGNPAVSDCAQWLFCCSCSLAQEVRTGDFYEIVEDKFYSREMDENDQPVLSPLHREDGSVQFRSFPSSPLRGSSSPSKTQTLSAPNPDRFMKGYHSPDKKLPVMEEEFSSKGHDITMAPPVPSSIKREP
ncbi:Uncharacterized protein family Cys-rich [Macleaya cordata]|uniref:Uncharacterized protein family Cys-rich n=1 Tax=Macleaya cordata TaxID=56857 RepID=A0A200QQB9_MACCD|nr:Uncharacterized protein family Cys-rich [Macleaya cordata]